MIYGVCGSRSLKEYERIAKVLDQYVGLTDIVVTGGAEGVDSLTEEWCKKSKIKCLVLYPINHYFNIPYNPVIYLARDKQLVDISDEIIAIWDGSSRGTKFTIDYAQKKGMIVHVH